MAEFRHTFETTVDGKTRGYRVEGPSFSLALEKASDYFKCSVNDVEHIKTERLDSDIWITIFDPFRGKF